MKLSIKFKADGLIVLEDIKYPKEEGDIVAFTIEQLEEKLMSLEGISGLKVTAIVDVE